jgi:type II secretory ATPase GspE/PulE/Tfp pilus assembly ATPase PilB-like protein
MGIFEVFGVDDEIVNIMGDKVEEEALRKAAKTQGMTTMKQDGILKVLKGITTLEEIERATEEESLQID